MDWDRGASPEFIPGVVGAEVSPDGGVTLAYMRFLQGEAAEVVVTDADGHVQSAVRSEGHRCSLDPPHVGGGHYVSTVRDPASSSAEKHWHMVGGSVQGSPTFQRAPDSQPRSYRPAPLGALANTSTKISLRPWAGGQETLLATAPLGVVLVDSFGRGDSLFWGTDNARFALQVWSADAGVRDLVSFPDDPTRGAGDLATDGRNMVWGQGSGRTSGTGRFPQVELYTAPYTTEPASLRRRPLVRLGTTFGFPASLPVVGCGYAARATYVTLAGEPKLVTLIVRLTDGHWWQLPASPEAFSWTSPLALTCDELFAQVHVARAEYKMSFARVRLDSLGPGGTGDLP